MSQQSAERRLSWKQEATLEAVAIVLSVLFALFLNDWWQERETRQSHQKTLVLIQNELNDNRSELIEAIEYYDAIMPKVRAILAADSTPDEVNALMNECCELKNGGGYRTAHETAMLTGLYAYLDPAVSSAIVTPYIGYGEMRPFLDASMIAIMSSDMTNPDELLSRFLVFSMSVRPSLAELLEQTDAGIEAVGKALERKP